jgi:DNA modification methylase
MTATVLRGDARHLPLADASVDLVCCSPPYFGLRSYQDGGEHYAGQIGDEPTPAEFVDALIEVTRECVRVLKPSGSLWVNLGDRYSSGTSGDRNNGFNERSGNAAGKRAQERSQTKVGAVAGMRPKSLIGVPWRYALRCIDDLGLILRAEVIWSKPNGLPESVTDRVRRSHETWFHFTREPRYFSAVDEVREGYGADSLARRLKYGQADRGGGYAAGNRNDAGRGGPMGFADAANANPLGKLPGSVWTIPTQPLTVPAHLGVDHFAAFPMELPRRIIRGWSPSGICTVCGEGRRPVVAHAAWWAEHKAKHGLGDYLVGQDTGTSGKQRATSARMVPEGPKHVITGESCACPTPIAPTRPSVILDPFGGTGTTALVASALGRHGISVDHSADYCRLARWRTTDPGQRAAAMQVDKPKPELPGQDSLFGDVA